MAIITISQGSYSGGRMLAEAVSQRLGYRCISRDEILQKAAQWGVPESELRAAIEKPPSFFGQSQHTKYRYLAFIQAALTDAVRQGDAVYSGLAAHLLLGKGQHVLRTRIIAPMAFRIAMVEFKRECDRKEAIAYIEKTDDDRRKWTRFLYGVDWTDPSLYDIVLNLELMTLVQACDAICVLAESTCFQTTPEVRADLEDLALASCVKANLARNSDTADLQFETTARAGAVTIRGGIESPAQAKKIRSLIERIPGVRTLTTEELSLVTRI